MTTLKFSFQLQTFKVCLFFSWFLTKYVSQNQKKTFTWMFECQILRIISDPLSILLAIKAYPFGLTFGLAPSFIYTYDNKFSILLGFLVLFLTFRFWERSFTNHHTRLRLHYAIHCYTHQFKQRANIFAFMLTSEFLKKVYHGFEYFINLKLIINLSI